MPNAATITYNPFSLTDLEARAGRILISLEVSMLCVGFEYMCVAIAEAYRDPSVAEYVTKTLVPRVAKLCGQNTSCVHRAMIRAVDYINQFPNKQAKKMYLGSENVRADILNVVNGVAKYLKSEDGFI